MVSSLNTGLSLVKYTGCFQQLGLRKGAYFDTSEGPKGFYRVSTKKVLILCRAIG